jgi:hypothetical protein
MYLEEFKNIIKKLNKYYIIIRGYKMTLNHDFTCIDMYMYTTTCITLFSLYPALPATSLHA